MSVSSVGAAPALSVFTNGDIQRYMDSHVPLHNGGDKMEQAIKKSKLEQLIFRNFPKVLKEESLASLGDRKEYVGSSDVGGCLRKAYLDKVEEVEYDMATLIRFERGHLSEGIVRKMLKGLKVVEQTEVKGAVQGFQLKSHIDFMLENKDECVVIEAKSVSSAITEPYESWILQVQYQLHLLKINRKKPVRAYIIVIDLNQGWFKTFEVDYNDSLAQMALRRAVQLIVALKEGKEPEAKEQLYCSSCSHKATCPLLNAGVTEIRGDMLQLAKELAELHKQKKVLENTIEAKAREMEDFMRGAAIFRVRTNDSFITLTSDSKYSTIDTKSLRAARPRLYAKLLEKFQRDVNTKGHINIK